MKKTFALVSALIAAICIAVPAAAAGVGDLLQHAANFDLFSGGLMLAAVGAVPATYAQQIASFEAKRASIVAGMEAIMAKAAEEGTTLDAAQQEEYDGFEADIEAIDGHLKRLRTLEKAVAAKASPAVGGSPTEGSTSRGTSGGIVVKTQPKLAPGIEFARLVKCYGMAGGNIFAAEQIAKARYGDDSNAVGTLKSLAMGGFNKIDKAAVVAGSTIDGNWAADLVSAEGGAFADFVEFLRPATILGRFGTNGIPALRSVPFRVPLGSQTGGGAGYWVGEGKPKPLTSFDFARTTLEPLKAANIAVLTEEIIRDASANSEMLVRDGLRDALAERIDTDFIDPANAGTAGVKPASITNGITSILSAGPDADDVRLDLRSLLQLYIDANNRPQSGVLIMQSGTALALGMLTNALGQPEFNGVGMNGGVLQGIPVITSEYVPDGFVVMVNASDIYFADEGGIAVDMSREASLQMLDNPTNDSVTPTATSMVSMFQTNSVAFRAERTLNWARRRAEAVQLLRTVTWGGAVTAPSAP